MKLRALAPTYRKQIEKKSPIEWRPMEKLGYS